MPRYSFENGRYIHNCDYDCPCYDRTFGKCGINYKKLDYVPVNGGYTPTPDWCPLKLEDDADMIERQKKLERKVSLDEATKALNRAIVSGVSLSDIVARVNERCDE